MRAVAGFNRRVRETDSDLVISKWLRNKLPKKEIRDLLPVKGSQDAQLGDIVLLQLVVVNQRQEFGRIDPLVAMTLDLLGEKYLNSGDYERAIVALEESLFIHSENDRDSESRVSTMLMLAKAFKRNGQNDKAELHLDSVRRTLERISVDSRLIRTFKELDSQ